MIYGTAYYPEHRDPARWEYDLDNMAEAGLNAIRTGEFAWCRLEPRPGEYDFAWLDGFAGKAERRGIRLVLCPPMRTAPAWLVEQDPSILIVDQSGVRLEFGSRYTFCTNHPLLREKGLALAEAMARHYGNHPGVMGWHLDNEYGDEPDCHCPICAGKWREWLRQRYGTIEALNAAWGNVFWSLEYTHFGQVPTPRVSKTFHSPAHLQAWRTFRSDCTVEITGLHAAALRPHAQGQPVGTNFQALWNFRTDYYRSAVHLDVCGTNYYPPYGENCRAAAFGLTTCRSYKDANFLVYELRNGPHAIPGRAENTPAHGEVRRLVLHTVANGADGVFFFRWRACPFGAEQSHGTITDYDGRPKRLFAEVQEVGQKMRALAPLLAGTAVRSEVAVLYDFPTRWAVETATAWSMPAGLYREHTLKLHRALCGLGLNCDAVGRAGEFGKYKILVVPLLLAVDDALVERLCRFVEEGGVLVWHPFCGTDDPDRCIYPDRLHSRLVDLLGLRPIEFATAGEREPLAFVWRQTRYAAGLFADLPALAGAAPLAAFADAWFAGEPALAENRSGRGRVLTVTTFAEEAFYRDLFAALCADAGVQPILAGPVPPAVEVTERTAPDGRRLIFILSASRESQVVPLERPMRDVWSGEMHTGRVELAPFGVCVLLRE